MILDGEFSYDDQNQRALPFNVEIQELREEMTLYVGSKSKSKIVNNITNLSKNSATSTTSIIIIEFIDFNFDFILLQSISV